MRPLVYVLGLDLGKEKDHAALAALGRRYRPGPDGYPESWYSVDGLIQFPIGTPYTTQNAGTPREEVGLTDRVRKICEQQAFRGCMLGIDWTGVGEAVVDFFRTARLPVWIRPIKITSGGTVTPQEDGGYHVAKSELVSTLEILLQNGRIAISPPPVGDRQGALMNQKLQEEFRVFNRRVSKAGNMTTGAEGNKHDDMVLAVSLAAWLGEHTAAGWDGTLTMGSPIPTAPKGAFVQPTPDGTRDYPSTDPYAGKDWYSADGLDKTGQGRADSGRVDPGSGIPEAW